MQKKSKYLMSGALVSLCLTQMTPLMTVYATSGLADSASSAQATTPNWATEYPKLSNPVFEKINYIEYSEPTMDGLSSHISKLNELKADFTVEGLSEFLESFGEFFITVPLEDMEKAPIYNPNAPTGTYDQFQYIFESIIYLGFVNNEKESREVFITNFIDWQYTISAKAWNIGALPHPSHGTSLYLYDIVGYMTYQSKAYNTIVIYESYMREMSDFNRYLVDGKMPEDLVMSDVEMPPEIQPTPPEENPDTIPPKPIPTPEPEIPPGLNPDGSVPPAEGLTSVEYYILNGTCYKRTTRRNMNDIIIHQQSEPTSIEGMCGVSIPGAVSLADWQARNPQNITFDVWGGLDLNAQNKLSDQTLQFTVTKDSDNPYYYDSGIRTTLAKTVTFSQLRDAFNLITLKTKGAVLEDTGKLMFVAEGKPMVLVDKKSDYTESEVGQIMESFESIGLKIDKMKLTAGTSETERNSVKVTLDGKDLALDATPLVKDGTLLVPIKSIAKALELELTEIDNTFTIAQGEHVVTLERDSAIISIDGTNKTLSTETYTENNVTYAEMTLALKTFGFNLSYNANEKLLTIIKN